MIAYVTVNDELVEKAVEQLEQWHQQTHGTGTESLVWVLAHQKFADRMEANIAKNQEVKARVSLISTPT
jgi:hypothetical protein